METEPNAEQTDAKVTLGDLARFLVGDRDAIERIGSSRAMLAVGAIFCLSAAFARDYDGSDLLSEPWHLVAPLGASLATSFLLFQLIYWNYQCWAKPALPYLAAYLRFLAMYWATAPLAWFYALPVEQVFEPAEAMQQNLYLLFIVSVWRVLLLTRCVAIYFGTRTLFAFFAIMLVADALVLGVLQFTPLPIFNIMGGIRLSPTEQIILSAALSTQVLGVLTLPIWLIGTAICNQLAPPETSQDLTRKTIPVDRKVVWFAIASVIVWFTILPFTQPAQQLKHKVVQAYKAQDYEQFVQFLSEHDPTDFPRSFEPPPWTGYAESDPALAAVLQQVSEQASPDWVRLRYLEKLERKVHAPWHLYVFTEDELAIYCELCDTLPGLTGVLATGKDRFEYRIERLSEDQDQASRLELLQAINAKLQATKIETLDEEAEEATRD